MLEERDEINNALGKHFNSIGVDSTLESDFKDRILNLMKEKDELAGTDENTLSILFTKESISNTLMKLKSGKEPGIDEIPNDFLKFRGDIMIHSLVDMLTAISDIEVIPDDWHSGIIRPLHKSGSLYDIDNYRGITLSSNVYKIFSKTIDSTAVNHLESNNIHGESQGAFRKDRRIENHIITLHGICSLAMSSKKPLYIAFLDLSKAFDRVWWDGLPAKLWESGIQGKPWCLKEIYRNAQNKVLFNDYESDYSDQEYGVKQGCVFCPSSFSLC
jgi:hypothetical protein